MKRMPRAGFSVGVLNQIISKADIARLLLFYTQEGYWTSRLTHFDYDEKSIGFLLNLISGRPHTLTGDVNQRQSAFPESEIGRT